MVKNKSKRIISWLDNGCYPGYVMFSCGFGYDEIINELKEMKAKDWLTGLSGDKEFLSSAKWFGLSRSIENIKTGHKKTLFYILLMEPFDFSDLSFCKLAHEILHICQFFLPDVLNRDREIEAEAYYHTHLMQQCLKQLRGNK